MNLPLDPPARTEVADRLWLGDAHPVADGRYDTVVTLDGSVGRYFPVPDSTVHRILELRDDQMEQHDTVDALTVWTWQRWQAGDRVLVRCAAGLNRSGLIVAGVLARQWRDLPAVLAHLRAVHHPDVLDNPSYVRHLERVHAGS